MRSSSTCTIYSPRNPCAWPSFNRASNVPKTLFPGDIRMTTSWASLKKTWQKANFCEEQSRQQSKEQFLLLLVQGSVVGTSLHRHCLCYCWRTETRYQPFIRRNLEEKISEIFYKNYNISHNFIFSYIYIYIYFITEKKTFIPLLTFFILYFFSHTLFYNINGVYYRNNKLIYWIIYYIYYLFSNTNNKKF